MYRSCIPLAPYTGSQSPHAPITATGQPCSSANSRNAAHASARCDDRADRVGRHERDAVVHAVRDERVAEAEPLLVVAQREVRQRVGAVLLDEEPRPLARHRPVRRRRVATPRGGTTTTAREIAMPIPTASSAGDTKRSSDCAAARWTGRRRGAASPRRTRARSGGRGLAAAPHRRRPPRSPPTAPARPAIGRAPRRRRVRGRGEVGSGARRGTPRRAARAPPPRCRGP